MSKTTQELVYEVLGMMGRNYVGEAPSNEDYQTVAAVIRPVVDALASDPECAVLIEDIDAIEERFFLSLASLVAVAVAPKIGEDSARSTCVNTGVATLEELRVREMVRLRRTARRRPTFKAHEGQYF